MSNEALSPARKIYPAHGDPIRIVPLHLPDAVGTSTAEAAAAPVAAPRLTYRNGPLIARPEVFTVFWGAAWQTAPQSTLASQLNQFFDFVLTSPLIDQLSEYSVPAYTIGHGRRTGSTTITTPALKHSVSDTAIRHMLQHEIATGTALPEPTPNTLYFVYLPPGVKVVQGGGASCQAFCGYHNDISGQVFYAAMPYPGCGGCTGGLSVLDALTSTSSHEMCEAITDAIPGQGWYDDSNGEIGDICAWKTKKLGAYRVQLEWSNTANKCL
ncbi:MAG TPA: hypothetical protein VEQ10_15935 [Vicinamibacteria bacterium]|nr:hypothetical protein [Vicinamibacteria bacterium]